jgi:hypothetical protein
MPTLAENSLLAAMLQAVEAALETNREALNGLDREYPQHGDHVVDIFHTAKQAADEQQTANFAEALNYVGIRLLNKQGDELAKIYGQGLSQIADQLIRRKISLEELVHVTQQQLESKTDNSQRLGSARSPEILKALGTGLINWSRMLHENGKPKTGLGLGDLFDLGSAYQKAKAENEDRAAILAQAAVSVSPLKDNKVYSLSGKIAFKALLNAIGSLAGSSK